MSELPEKNIRIKRYFDVVAHGPDTVEIRYGVWNPVSFLLNDEAKTGNLFRVLKRLDGTSTPATLARELGVAREQVEGLIDHLDQFGVLESGPSNALDYYLDNVAPPHSHVDEMLAAPAARPMVLLGDASLTSQIGDLLAEIDPEIQIATADERAARVVLDDDVSWMFDAVAFEERMQALEPWKTSFLVMASSVINPLRDKVLNRGALEHGFPWLHAALDGPFLLIGPLFIPGRSACYECFERRVTMNLRDGSSYVAYKEALVNRSLTRGRMPMQPMLRALLSAHAAVEIVNFTKTNHSFVVGKVLSVFLPTMEFTYNEVLRVPGCPACGPLSERDDTELHFDMTTLINRKS